MWHVLISLRQYCILLLILPLFNTPCSTSRLFMYFNVGIFRFLGIQGVTFRLRLRRWSLLSSRLWQSDTYLYLRPLTYVGQLPSPEDYGEVGNCAKIILAERMRLKIWRICRTGTMQPIPPKVQKLKALLLKTKQKIALITQAPLAANFACCALVLFLIIDPFAGWSNRCSRRPRRCQPVASRWATALLVQHDSCFNDLKYEISYSSTCTVS